MSKQTPWKEIWLFMPEGDVSQRTWLMTQLAGLGQKYKWVEVRKKSSSRSQAILPLGVDHVIRPSGLRGLQPRDPGIEDAASTLFIWVGTTPDSAQLRWLSRWKKVWKAALINQEEQDPVGFHFWLKTSHTPSSSHAWQQLADVLAQVPATGLPAPNVGPTETRNFESEP